MSKQKNTIELMGSYGGDIEHALSAWTSTYRELTPKKKERIPDLLLMLASEGHHTPFEKSSLQFLIRCDDATHIHLLKHRIGVSINGESGRYKKLKDPTGLIPDDWSIPCNETRVDDNGQTVLSEQHGKTWAEVLADHHAESVRLYHTALSELEEPLGRSRAKESARFFLPKNNQITLDVMFNWRSFTHFLGLRLKPNAQKEIRDLSQQALDLVKGIEGNPFEKTIEAFKL